MHLQSFKARIAPTTVRSIDSFLEKRQGEPEITETGRAVIAALLGTAIQKAAKEAPISKDDWLAQVVDRMHQGAPDWGAFTQRNSSVQFVTFNFDSVIEDRLTEQLNGVYDGMTNDKICAALPVIHVHGQVPRVPVARLFADSITPFPREWTKWVRDASATIRIAHEGALSQSAREAQKAVQKAHVLCFLGYGYDKGNLEQLGLPQVLGAVPPNAIKPREVYGSAFGLTAGVQEEVKARLLGKITLGSIDDRCEDVLEKHYVLRG